jgi:hypothetical protein
MGCWDVMGDSEGLGKSSGEAREYSFLSSIISTKPT